MSLASTPSSVGCAAPPIGGQVLAHVPVQVLVGGSALSLVFRYKVNPPLVMTVPTNVTRGGDGCRGPRPRVGPPMGVPFPTGAARLAGTPVSDVPQPDRARGAARSRAAAPARHEEGSDMAVTVGTPAGGVADAEGPWRSAVGWARRAAVVPAERAVAAQDRMRTLTTEWP